MHRLGPVFVRHLVVDPDLDADADCCSQGAKGGSVVPMGVHQTWWGLVLAFALIARDGISLGLPSVTRRGRAHLYRRAEPVRQ